MKKIFLTLLAFSFCWACQNPLSVEGEWTKPVPLKKGEFHGMVFEKGGTARSINMPDLQYQTWQQKGNILTLTGKTVYGGESFVFSESYTVKTVTPAMLVLITNNGEEITYARKI